MNAAGGIKPSTATAPQPILPRMSFISSIFGMRSNEMPVSSRPWK
jgi:hypothetical protein